MNRLSNAQIAAASGKPFDAIRVLHGSSRVVFCTIYPSGNVGVKYENDRECFGPITVPAVQAEPLFQAIEGKFNRRGHRKS